MFFRRVFKILLLVAYTLSPSHLIAAEEFEPSSWTEGLHLFGGAGPSSSLFVSAIERRDFGVGAHIKADLSYVLNDRWAAEWSSGVDFNKVESYLAWNNLFTFGVRYRISVDPFFKISSSYVKAFVGRAPAVIYFYEGTPDEYRKGGVERLHFDGTVIGLSSGMFHKAKGGLIWFHEFTATGQTLDRFDAIRMEGEVPVVVPSESFRSGGTIYGVFFTIGVMIF